MATPAEVVNRIAQTFITDWAGATPITLENDNFSPPNGDWVRLVVRHRTSNQGSLGGVGNRKFFRGGSVIVSVFTLLNTGTKNASTLAQAARNVFEGKTLLPEDIRFTDVVEREIGPSEGYYMINVEAFFNYDETK